MTARSFGVHITGKHGDEERIRLQLGYGVERLLTQARATFAPGEQIRIHLTAEPDPPEASG